MADFEAGGRAAIERCRLERPDVYVRLVASLLPKELEIKENPFDGFTDDELHDLMAALSGTLGVHQNASGSSETSH